MAEQGLAARSPLAGVPRTGVHGRGGAPGVTMTERTGLDLVLIAAHRGQGAGVAEAVRRTFGLDLPEGPRRIAGDEVTVLWSGRERWIAMAEGLGDGVLERRLRDALPGMASVVGQGDGRVVLRLSGPRARDLLAKAVAVDLHPRAFRTNDVALTAAFHIAVQLWLLDDGVTFEMSVAASYAATLHAWLIDAGREYGIAVD